MRNLKRYLAIVVAIAMILTLMAPIATAAESKANDFSADATKLNELGLYKGISETSFNPDLGSTLDRQTAATMLLRMFGEEEDAKTMEIEEAKATLKTKFIDASTIADWAARQVAAAVEDDVIKGFPEANGKFSFQPKGLLTVNQYATLVLKKLGYEVPKFDMAGAQFAQVSNATTEEMTPFFAAGSGAMKKSLLIGMSFKALTCKMSGKETTLAEELVKTGTVAKEKFEAIGILIPDGTPATNAPTAEPTAATSIKVTSVTATNARLTVVLDTDPAVAPVAADFSVVKKTYGVADASVVAAVYSYTAATKTALLDFTPVAAAAADQKVTFTVAYKGGTPVTSNEITVVAGFAVNSVMAINTTTTDALETKVESGAKFAVEFSTALDTTTAVSTNFSLKKGTLETAVSVALSSDKKTITVTPLMPLTVAGSYTFTVGTGFKSAAGAALSAVVTKTFTIVDTLSLTSVKVGGTDVDKYTTALTALTVKFNKNIDSSTVNTGTIKIYNETDAVYIALLSSSLALTPADTITITPTADYITGKKYSLRINGLKALDSASLDGYKKIYGVAAKPVAVPAALTAPTGAGNIYPGISGGLFAYAVAPYTPAGLQTFTPVKSTVQFARAMDSATVNADNFYIAKVDPNGAEIAGTKVASNVTYDVASYSATIAPTVALAEKTDYAVFISNNMLDSASVPYADGIKRLFTTDDFAAPTVKSTSVDTGARVLRTDDVVVRFSEKMQAASMALVGAATASKAAFTAATSVRLYDQTNNNTIDTTNVGIFAGIAFDTTFAADTTDPRIIIKAPTAGWPVSTTVLVTINGYEAGEGFMVVCDQITGAKVHGNMLAGNYEFTFTTQDSSRPAVAGVKATKTVDGPYATTPGTSLSKVDMTYGIQNAGATTDNQLFEITYDSVMKVGTTAANSAQNPAYYTLALDTNFNGLFTDAGESVVLTNGTTANITVDTTGKKFTLKLAGTELTRITSGSYEGRLTIAYNVNGVADATDSGMGTSASDNVSYKFTTGKGPAMVTNTSLLIPTTYATGVATGSGNPTDVKVVFDKVCDYTTLNTTNIMLKDPSGATVPGRILGAAYPATTAIAANTNAVWYRTDASLLGNTVYTVEVGTGVKDAVGNPSAGFRYYFTTAITTVPVATVTAPSLTSGTDPFVVKYNTAMNVDSTWTTGTIVPGAGILSTETVSFNGATMTFTVSGAATAVTGVSTGTAAAVNVLTADALTATGIGNAIVLGFNSMAAVSGSPLTGYSAANAAGVVTITKSNTAYTPTTALLLAETSAAASFTNAIASTQYAANATQSVRNPANYTLNVNGVVVTAKSVVYDADTYTALVYPDTAFVSSDVIQFTAKANIKSLSPNTEVTAADVVSVQQKGTISPAAVYNIKTAVYNTATKALVCTMTRPLNAAIPSLATDFAITQGSYNTGSNFVGLGVSDDGLTVTIAFKDNTTNVLSIVPGVTKIALSTGSYYNSAGTSTAVNGTAITIQ